MVIIIFSAQIFAFLLTSTTTPAYFQPIGPTKILLSKIWELFTIVASWFRRGAIEHGECIVPISVQTVPNKRNLESLTYRDLCHQYFFITHNKNFDFETAIPKLNADSIYTYFDMHFCLIASNNTKPLQTWQPLYNPTVGCVHNWGGVALCMYPVQNFSASHFLFRHCNLMYCEHMVSTNWKDFYRLDKYTPIKQKPLGEEMWSPKIDCGPLFSLGATNHQPPPCNTCNARIMICIVTSHHILVHWSTNTSSV